MSHKADKSFFRVKREWSRQKDLVLGHYLTPYLAKIATQGRPVLVVDGFAGPGRFEDGEAGSPVIICEAVAAARLARPSHSVSALLIEKDQTLATALRHNTKEYEAISEIRAGSFESVLPELVKAIDSHNVFLYLDPFTVKGLLWADLDQLFRQVSRVKSVEVLMNFNVFALGRAACVALGKNFADAGNDESDFTDESTSTLNGVDAVLGGNWWQELFRGARSFPEACGCLASGYLKNLRLRFPEVCHHELKERHAHAVPKYLLVFGSRHPHALELMNDGMAKCLKVQAASELPALPQLFETRPVSLVPDVGPLDAVIVGIAGTRMSRGDLILSTIRRMFGLYTRAEIRGRIEELLKSKKLVSATGVHRINDTVEVWTSH